MESDALVVCTDLAMFHMKHRACWAGSTRRSGVVGPGGAPRLIEPAADPYRERTTARIRPVVTIAHGRCGILRRRSRFVAD